jgi:hypothetical protein
MMKQNMKWVGIMAVLFFGCALFGCAGSSKKTDEVDPQAAEQKGSMSQTFTLVDEQGRKAGTLTLRPFGGAVLHDADGKVLKEFQPGGSPQQQSTDTPSEPEAIDDSESEMPEAESDDVSEAEMPEAESDVDD